MVLTIKYARDKVVAFCIGAELYYLDHVGTPKLYNSSLDKMIVPNIDNWMQSKTKQRYSYRGLLDMADSFSSALNHNYTSDDLRDICDVIVEQTRDTIFKTELARYYASAYWIELTEPSKIQKLIDLFRDRFDDLLKKYGDDKMYDLICRLWQFCNLHMPSEAAIFDSLARRLGHQPRSPKYPDTSDVDIEIKRLVSSAVIGQHLSEYKEIPDELVDTVNRLRKMR